MHEDQRIKRMGQGDAHAAEELVSQYYPQILHYCIWHVPIRSLAEDAAQETFLKALRYFDQYDHRGHFKAYLYRIASNVCIDMARKHSIRDSSLEEEESLQSEDCNLEAVETRTDVEQMLRILPPHLREVIFLRFSQDLTLREISQALDLPLRTIQSQLRAALKTLKNTYREGDFL